MLAENEQSSPASQCIIYDLFLTFLGRIAFVVFNLIFLALLCAVSSFFPRSIWMKAGKFWGRVCLFLLRIRWEIIAPERLSVPPGEETVYAAMHSSLLDTFLYPAILPSNTVYVAKASLRNFPLLGSLLRKGGFIFVDRNGSQKDARQFLASVRNLAKGTHLFLHPEGTRIPDGEARRSFPGFAMAARQRRARVTPLLSSEGSALWRRGAIFPQPGKVLIWVGEPWPPEDVMREKAEGLCARYEALVNRTFHSVFS